MYTEGIPGRVMRTVGQEDFLRVLDTRRDEFSPPFAVMECRRHDVVIAQRVKKGLSACNDKVYQISPWASRPEGHWRNDPLLTLLHKQLSSAAQNPSAASYSDC